MASIACLAANPSLLKAHFRLKLNRNQRCESNFPSLVNIDALTAKEHSLPKPMMIYARTATVISPEFAQGAVKPSASKSERARTVKPICQNCNHLSSSRIF